MTEHANELAEVLEFPVGKPRNKRMPKTRAECADVPRPCPFVRCRYNNFLVVKDNGSIKYHHGHDDPTAVPAETSCALDVADRGEHTLEQVGQIFQLTRERVRQLEGAAFRKLRRRGMVIRQLFEAAKVTKPAWPLPTGVDT